MAMSKKQMVQETVFNGESFCDEWPPEDPKGFMAWFQAQINKIPPEHRDKAVIEIGTQSGYYGDSSANIEITYLRPETDEQFASRLQREERDRQAAVGHEKRVLAALLAKYGPQ